MSNNDLCSFKTILTLESGRNYRIIGFVANDIRFKMQTRMHRYPRKESSILTFICTSKNRANEQTEWHLNAASLNLCMHSVWLLLRQTAQINQRRCSLNNKSLHHKHTDDLCSNRNFTDSFLMERLGG